MPNRLRTLNMIVVASLAVTGIAAAAGKAPPCHPDLAGTRTLIVTGAVTDYRFSSPGTLAVSSRTGPCANWDYAANTTATVSCRGGSSTARPAAVAKKLVAAQGNRMVRIVLAPAGADSPDRLDVFARSTGRRLASWPLIAYSNPRNRPTRVALYGGIAVVSGGERGALYAVRISDGRIAELAIERAGDRPVIGRDGVAYQDSIYVRPTRHGFAPNQVALKLVPLASVEEQLSQAGREIVTSGPIGAIGMDGQRVAYTVHDPAGRCDSVRFWIPTWNFAARVTHRVGPTCLPTHAAGGVTNVAIADDRLVFTTTYGQTTRVLAASSIGCEEWVVARPARGSSSVSALAGDGTVLAYALKSGAVGLVPAHWRGKVISHSSSEVEAMSVDSNRIATLHRDRTVTVMTATGAPISSFAVGQAHAVALHGDAVAVLGSGHLAIYNATTGVRTNSWRVPAGSRTVDLEYGIAVVAAGHDVLALNVATGHTARLLHAGGRVAAQLDSPGAIVKYNAGSYGHIRFIPMSTIEARTS